MDPSTAATNVSDLQSYLANFQKDIRGPQTVTINGQPFIIQPAPVQMTQPAESNNVDIPEGKDQQSETASNLLENDDQSLIDQPKPLLPLGTITEGLSGDGVQDGPLESSLQTIMDPQTNPGATAGGAASIMGDGTDSAQLMTLSGTSIAPSQLIVQNGDQILAAVAGGAGCGDGSGVVTGAAPSASVQTTDVLMTATPQVAAINPGALAPGPSAGYQTVTIVPSGDVNQQGEMSYVLIVSHPEGATPQKPEEVTGSDLSVYDFKEDKGAISDMEDEELMELEDMTCKRTPVSQRQATLPRKITQQLSGTQLMCNYCNYTSSKRYLLSRHMRIHSDDRPHKCNICDRGFKTVASLQNHINTHTGVRPHKCKECPSAFTTSGELVRHVRYRHTFEKPHKCTECDYASVELSKLKRHIRSHTGERPYQCPHCNYASPDTYKLKRHLRIHTGEKPYECDICHARFTQSNTLNSHRLIHTGNKPVFQCELCPTTCGRKTDLKIHVQKLHTSEKPLVCKKCGKAFPDRYTYKIHMKTHEGEKCFRCELCPYSALSQRHLENHILTHTGEKPYNCTECDQTFRQKQLLKRHMNLYHTPNYIPPAPRERQHECGDCHKVFAHRGNLMKHMALHDPDNADDDNLRQQVEAEIEQSEQQYMAVSDGDEGGSGSDHNVMPSVSDGVAVSASSTASTGDDGGGTSATSITTAVSGSQVVLPDGQRAEIVHLTPEEIKQQTNKGHVLQLMTNTHDNTTQILLEVNGDTATDTAEHAEEDHTEDPVSNNKQRGGDAERTEVEEDESGRDDDEPLKDVENTPKIKLEDSPIKHHLGQPAKSVIARTNDSDDDDDYVHEDHIEDTNGEVNHVEHDNDGDDNDEVIQEALLIETPVVKRRRGRPSKSQHTIGKKKTRSSKRSAGTRTSTSKKAKISRSTVKDEKVLQKERDIQECFGFNVEDD